VRISMDGRGRFLDNIFIERLWRSLKYECIYLHAFSGGRAARQGIGNWMNFLQPSPPACRAWRQDAGRCISRRRSVYIEKGCRPPARAYALTSTRRPW
jgi:transposase InsO family protein